MFVINRAYYDAIQKTEIIIPADRVRVVPDFRWRFVDVAVKNLLFLVFVLRAAVVHIAGPGFVIYPAALMGRKILRYRLIFSFTGTSLDHQLQNAHSVRNAERIRSVQEKADLTEVLNPAVLEESWLRKDKLVVAPCSFSDPDRYHIEHKERLIVFAGHFLRGKGIEELREILLAGENRGYRIHIFGSANSADRDGRMFAEWLEEFRAGNSWVSVARRADMSNAYATARYFVSLQHISNYPSQAVLEAMLSGCHVLMADTGDSRAFGSHPFITYMSREDIQQFWTVVAQSDARWSDAQAAQGRKYVIENHSLSRYAEHLQSMWNESRL